ncbi:hypothetical protein ACHAWF_008391, partial [Thalassiosira exigua]
TTRRARATKADPTLLFAFLFGSHKFGDYLGRLSTATSASVADSPKVGPNEARIVQRWRVASLAIALAERLRAWAEEDYDGAKAMWESADRCCLDALFRDEPDENKRLLRIIEQDLQDIRDILKSGLSCDIIPHSNHVVIAVSLMKWKADRIAELLSGYGDAIAHGTVCWDVSKAKLCDVYEEAVAAVPSSHRVHFVMTGYVASNTHGVATTYHVAKGRIGLLRGHHGTTASVVEHYHFDGRAYVIPDVSYHEAMELAYFGAKVIHPKTMQPAISANPQIPIYIRNRPNSEELANDKWVCGFSSIENMALINVEVSGMIGVQGIAKRLFGTLETLGVNVVLISQASSEHSITFATVEEQVTLAKEALEEEFRREIEASRIQSIEVKQPISIIAAVGDGMQSIAGVSGKFFSALGAAKINVLAISQGCSERNISAVVMMKDSTRALRAIHAAFRLSHTTVRVGIVGVSDDKIRNELGDSLLKLMQSQRNRLQVTFDVDVQVCCISPNSGNPNVVCLAKDDSWFSDSITSSAYEDAISQDEASSPSPRLSFKGFPDKIAEVKTGGLAALGDLLHSEECTHHVIFDCTADPEAAKKHSQWLQMGLHVVTANSTGLAGPKEQVDQIIKAERANGKLTCYLREVTVGGALPVINTLHSLLDSGDSIRRMDGILSVSLSYILFRVSPPPDASRASKFDEHCTQGIFREENPLDVPCKFSEAIQEAITLGLMEADPTMDLNNTHAAQNLMVLAQELGFGSRVSVESILQSSEEFVQFCLSASGNKSLDYSGIVKGSMDEQIQARVDRARENGSVLRHVASVDVRERKTAIKIVEVPANHVFALTPPSCECVRFFTHRHRTYPLVIQGPSAGHDSTASALLAELLRLMSVKVGPKRVMLSKTGSSASLGLQ